MNHRTVAIVLAAGQGKRMNSKVHKQYLLIQGRPVLSYALKTFEDSFIDEVILVTAAEEIEYCRQEIVEKYGFHKVKQIVAGGKERYHSVAHGLEAVENADYIFIHDGARPFVTQDILNRSFEEVQKEQACVAGMPVKDTIRIADENGYANQTPKRNLVWNIQTPQVFAADLIQKAYQALLDKEEEILASGILITDDAMVVEHFASQPVKLVQGSYENIKITTPEDLDTAEIFCRKLFPST